MTARYPLVLNGTTIEELQSADTLAGVDAFPAGTAMLFIQTAAPTGWTKSTTHDNKALRIVSGTAGSGGSTAFTSVFGSRTPSGSVDASGLSAGATTLSTAQMPSHTHNLHNSAYVGGAAVGWSPSSGQNIGPSDIGTWTLATGGGGSHSHSMSGSATFTGTAMDFAVQYVDAIIATKN